MYGYNNFGNPYMQSIQPRPMYMNQPQIQDEQGSPFQIVKFVNETEAQGFVLLPNQKALLMDTANMKFWIKWTDSLGNSTMETYKFEKTDNATNNKEIAQSIDIEKFVVKDDLKKLATIDEIKLIKENIEELRKQIKISQIMSEKPATTLKGE